MAQQWFIKTKSGVVGPLTTAKLKELAKRGKIKPKSAISLDGDKWFVASKVKDLFPSPVEELEAIELAPFDIDAIPAPTSGLVSQRETAYGKIFGPGHEVNHQFGPGQPHIDVYTYLPTKNRPFTTLVTGGMSDHDMPVPPGGECSRRCELMFYLEKPDILYINLLRFLASQPYLQKTWFSYGSTMNNGNPPQPIFDGSVLDHYLFLMPIDSDFGIQETVSIAGSPLQLLLVTPITTAERKLIVKKGMEGFLPLMDKNEHPLALDPNRSCYAKRKGWFG